MLQRAVQVPIQERDELVATLASNPTAYSGVARSQWTDGLHKVPMLTTISAGMGMGKTFAMRHFQERVRQLPDAVLRRPMDGWLPPAFVDAEVNRLRRGHFRVVHVALHDEDVDTWFEALTAAAKELGLDAAAMDQLDAIKRPSATDTHAHCLRIVLKVIAVATWTPATKTLIVFLDEAMAKGVTVMSTLRSTLMGIYSVANTHVRKLPGDCWDADWDALPRMQFVLASAGLVDETRGSVIHNWLSVPPLTVTAITNMRTSLQHQRWLPVRLQGSFFPSPPVHCFSVLRFGCSSASQIARAQHFVNGGDGSDPPDWPGFDKDVQALTGGIPRAVMVALLGLDVVLRKDRSPGMVRAAPAGSALTFAEECEAIGKAGVSSPKHRRKVLHHMFMAMQRVIPTDAVVPCTDASWKQKKWLKMCLCALIGAPANLHDPENVEPVQSLPLFGDIVVSKLGTVTTLRLPGWTARYIKAHYPSVEGQYVALLASLPSHFDEKTPFHSPSVFKTLSQLRLLVHVMYGTQYVEWQCLPVPMRCD